ncbi:N-acetylglucosamine-6-phosphate deacetylase [Konateibacter massiliensis]|uniref:N-acetylglucosamine-6-phosphate deacetylase n=1 Tax=Konateibacter massiliensis TaxID=2002841 RepID=UPI000C14A2F6|nr:N-acetylglucosamine-6-phosphate deacetylase [Konateibacter massiliensis]
MLIKNGFVFQENSTFQKTDIAINEELLADVSTDGKEIDASGLYVIPGLIDIHFHGCVGYDFCDGTSEALKNIAEYEAKCGITSIIPASLALNDENLEKIFENAHNYNNESGAMLMGIHMEGPYLAPAKKGAHNEAYLKTPFVTHFNSLNEKSGNMIKILSLAPELDGALDAIEELKSKVVLSLAHTTAGYELAMEAFQKGASHVTHLYNAMLPFSHREPGLVGAAFDTPDSKVELISDGIHVSPPVIRATFKMFGRDRIVLISDSMRATGLENGEYTLGDLAVTVKDNKATLHDGTIAGSATNLMDCMKKAVSFGIPLEDAVTCATINPAKQTKIYDKVGSITTGKYANLVLLDKDLNVVSVILRGNVI